MRKWAGGRLSRCGVHWALLVTGYVLRVKAPIHLELGQGQRAWSQAEVKWANGPYGNSLDRRSVYHLTVWLVPQWPAQKLTDV